MKKINESMMKSKIKVREDPKTSEKWWEKLQPRTLRSCSDMTSQGRKTMCAAQDDTH